MTPKYLTTVTYFQISITYQLTLIISLPNSYMRIWIRSYVTLIKSSMWTVDLFDNHIVSFSPLYGQPCVGNDVIILLQRQCKVFSKC